MRTKIANFGPQSEALFRLRFGSVLASIPRDDGGRAIALPSSVGWPNAIALPLWEGEKAAVHRS